MSRSHVYFAKGVKPSFTKYTLVCFAVWIVCGSDALLFLLIDMAEISPWGASADSNLVVRYRRPDYRKGRMKQSNECDDRTGKEKSKK